MLTESYLHVTLQANKPTTKNIDIQKMYGINPLINFKILEKTDLYSKPLKITTIDELSVLPYIDISPIYNQVLDYLDTRTEEAQHCPEPIYNFVKETKDHSYHTQILLPLLYHFLGANQNHMDQIRVAALAHDLGKFHTNVANALCIKGANRKFLQPADDAKGLIIEQIENNDFQTNPDAYDVFHQKTHPLLGARTIRKFFNKYTPDQQKEYKPLIELMTQVALYHHISYSKDNTAIHVPGSYNDASPKTGYPYPIYWSDLPKVVQWMNLVDVYCALRQKRVYKKAFDHESTLKIVRAEFPTIFSGIFSTFYEQNSTAIDACF